MLLVIGIIETFKKITDDMILMMLIMMASID